LNASARPAVVTLNNVNAIIKLIFFMAAIIVALQRLVKSKPTRTADANQ
jgi:hypothetical protein